MRKRRDIPFSKIFWLFGAFIVACGTTHLLDAIIFWEPLYRLAALVKLLTAAISWITVFMLIPLIPQALAMRTPTELENEVDDRMAELRQANEALRMRDRAISAAHQGILITDADADQPIVFASDGFERITGYAADEIIGRNCRFLQGQDTDALAVAQIRESVATATPCTVELLNYRKDGTEFWNELSISPVRDDGGRLTHFVGVQSDVSERKNLEEQLRQSQKLESVGQLAGGVAHDFNNMLTIINGCGDLVLTSLAADDAMRPLINEIRTAGERAADLTRQLLAFSRRQMMAPQILDLNQVVAETETLLVRLVGEGIRLAIRLEPELGSVHADRGQMQQVLLNLALNARDAMPRGGTLTISTANVPAVPKSPRANGHEPRGPQVVLEVADTGNGISQETKTRLFEPFFTTKPSGSGTGLGLAVVHGIVTQAGGHIEVASEFGHGTALRVHLPRVESGAAIAATQDGVSTDLPAGDEMVLVVEDEVGVRNLVQRVLSRCGYKVLAAADGPNAVALAKNTSTPFDLLITDVVMPGIGGSEVARQIREVHPEVRVLYISGYTDDAVLREGVIYDKVEFLMKPFSPSALAHKVREILDGRS